MSINLVLTPIYSLKKSNYFQNNYKNMFSTFKLHEFNYEEKVNFKDKRTIVAYYMYTNFYFKHYSLYCNISIYQNILYLPSDISET